MTLSELIRELNCEMTGKSPACDITGVIYDSRKIIKDCVFVCIQGANFDGHQAAAEACEKGAAAIVTQKDVALPENADVCVVRVGDTREALAKLSAAWFHYPAKELKVIGVTGTKGKTTTTYLIKSILEHAGRRVGLIGTIEVIIGEKRIPALNTTPESYTLQEYFRQMADEGIEIVVMEVSSQGLMMHRTDAIPFELGIFTNIEPDHIGPNEHADFADYLRCKGLLFKQCQTGILNADDAHIAQVLEGHTCSTETFGTGENADLRAVHISYVNQNGSLGVAFDTEGLANFHAYIDIPGMFSVYNALCAIAVCRHFGISEEDVQAALLHAKVKGRIELIKLSPDYTLMIDYAHNAMALKSLLTTLKAYDPGRLVCVFGCGGNRAKSRRFEMGEVSGQLADLTVITSDNPRFEEPLSIIADIRTGIEKTKGAYVEIPDRKEAIRYVIENAQKGDVIVLAGKGHEDYQEIKGVKYPMDERVLIKEVVEELNNPS
ncbi:MAG: UDP-N-acetylmuramoyl-L-alanyl-D-glutamate--2,6-diaminopimelate ligase [Lachnospiraceae bacterium]|nr:UDP-N-acetylmuramoyl-L-alanyl-D-glutamate--2,6-diaminopimelate ligase [Lachnospiraceae bacterium]